MRQRKRWLGDDFETVPRGTQKKLDELIEDVQFVLTEWRYGRATLDIVSHEKLCDAINKATGVTP